MDDFDPTADFLAREQAALGGDTEFLSGFTSAPTSSTANDSAQDFESSFPSFDNVTSSITSPPMSNSSHIPPSVVVADNDDDFGAFHSDFPAIETSDVPASQVSVILLTRCRDNYVMSMKLTLKFDDHVYY